MTSSLLGFLSVLGLIVAALALITYSVVRAFERRSAGRTEESEKARSLDPPESSTSVPRLSTTPRGSLHSEDIRQADLLEPVAEAIEDSLEEALAKLSSFDHDLLVEHYELGFPLRDIGQEWFRGRGDEERLREARLRFNEVLETELEKARHVEEDRDKKLREALEIICARKEVA